MKAVSDAQVRKLMEEMSKHGRLGIAAMRAGMDRKTARKYVAGRKAAIGDGRSRGTGVRRPGPVRSSTGLKSRSG